uniref:Uncharacterized protein n=1 Tax=Mycolicibacterium sp. CBMA 213 TaxID=1968788 RepID=A0A1S6GKY3_9MYCO|nr:hypothetical protein pCBMA213_2_00160 [Mycolicibacterium sp. CBMA 213]
MALGDYLSSPLFATPHAEKAVSECISERFEAVHLFYPLPNDY